MATIPRPAIGCSTVVIFAVLVSLATPASAQRVNLLLNGSVEDGSFTTGPFGWTRQTFESSASLTWDSDVAHDAVHSIKISADRPNDAAWIQTIALEPDTNYLLSGWVKTENVARTGQAVDAGANLCLYGTWSRTAAVLGTTDWTQVRMSFNSGATGSVTIGARLGFWSGVTTGIAWFDDLRVTEIKPTDPHPRWNLLVLLYDATDFTYVDGAITRHVVGRIDAAQLSAAADAARRFVLTDIPALASGNMVPALTIRYPGTLGRLSPNGGGWWPSPNDTAPERDPAFDGVIVVWQPTVVDQTTGENLWIGSAAGLTPSMGVDQTYTTLIIEAATLYGHLNVFKHEWGHSILDYFDAAGVAPKPTVTNHTDGLTYVNCGTGGYYVWIDETDATPIPNSIYNNESGFTHDYYSGTTALATDPTHCLGITASAWAAGGPVSKPDPEPPPPSDLIPPVTTATVSPPQTVDGWNNSDVSVTLSAADNGGGSGVKQITFAVAGAPDVPATTIAGDTAVVSIAAEGTSRLSFFATDNAGNAAPPSVVDIRIDLTGPRVTPPPNQRARQTTKGGTEVNYPAPVIVEAGSGIQSANCVPESGSIFAVGSTTVTCTATDFAGNTGVGAFSVVVTRATDGTSDEGMSGIGMIDEHGEHHHFAFRVAHHRNGNDGRFEYWVDDAHQCGHDDDFGRGQISDRGHDDEFGHDQHGPPSHFEATSINAVVFYDDRRLDPSRGSRLAVQTVRFSGTGRWNGRGGYTFEVLATDQGGTNSASRHVLARDQRLAGKTGGRRERASGRGRHSIDAIELIAYSGAASGSV